MLRILVPTVVLLAMTVGVAAASAPDETVAPPPPVHAGEALNRTAAVDKKITVPLRLPNIALEVRKLQSADRAVAARQLKSSSNVLTFWRNHQWILAPNHEKCWQVPWQRSCTAGRASVRLHTRLSETAGLVLERTDPMVGNLNRGLRGTPMAGLGSTLREIGKRYNVSPYFMAAAAGTESSFGAAGCGNNPRNVWGLAACDGRWYVPYFNSWDEAIEFYAKFIQSHWPNATSPFHLYGYAACDACWGRKTSMWMSSRFGVAAYTKFPG